MRGCGGFGSQSRQRAIWAALAVLSCALHSTVALTQDSSDPMEICSRISGSTARLACFDDEMRRRHAAAHLNHVAPAAIAPTPSPPSAVVPSTAASLTTARTQTSDGSAGPDRHPPEPMVVTLTRLTQRPGHQYSFELDNGQVWESTDAEGDLFLGPHESVTIRAGVMGAFFLKTQSGLSIRVHRLR